MRTYCSRVCMCVVCFLVLPSSAGLQPLQSASVSHSVISDSLGTMGCRPARLLCPRHTSGKNTGVGCHSHLQRIFSTQGMNLGLPHFRQILYCLSRHQWINLTMFLKPDSPGKIMVLPTAGAWVTLGRSPLTSPLCLSPPASYAGRAEAGVP